MDIKLIISHWILAIILFIVINWIGKNSIHAGYIQMSVLVKSDEAPAFNFLYRAFSPIIFITIASAFFYTINADWLINNIFMVVIYYFIFRIIFNLATGRGLLLNWITQIAYMAVSIPVSLFIYHKVIIHKAFLFPTSEELGSAIWLAVVAYIYQTFNKINLSDERTKKRKANYLDDRYQHYKMMYGSIINSATSDKSQEMLIYAILIFEAFNRPKIYRKIENILFYFGLAKTLGIMQFTTDRIINDEESVSLGAAKVVSDYIRAKMEIEAQGHEVFRGHLRRKVIALYNPDNDYISEVDALYNQLIDTYTINVPRDWD